MKQIIGNELPAIAGGRAVRQNYLVFGQPSIGEEEIMEVVDTLRSGWLGPGPKANRFANHFREYIGSRFAIPTTSCTAALHLSLAACGIGSGDEVITTPMTFVATLNAIIHQGAVPVLADIQPHSFHIDPDEIARKITKKQKLLFRFILAVLCVICLRYYKLLENIICMSLKMLPMRLEACIKEKKLERSATEE